MDLQSANRLREVAADISTEQERLATLSAQITAVRQQISAHPDLSPIIYESLALKLHNFYTGCERIFQVVASELNGGLPSQFDWHRRLLSRMTSSTAERPSLLSSETAKQLEDYLAFRHVVRNIYGFELDPVRLDALVEQQPAVWNRLQQDMQTFTEWLLQLAAQLEANS